jgi:branched-chain amino acid transport system substrate-binding protein
MASYAINNLKSKKIAVLYENNDIGKDGLNGIKAKLSKLRKGAFLGVAIPYNPTEVDFSSHIRLIAKAKPDVVIVYGNAKPVAGSVLEAKKQGLKAQFMASYIVADVTMFALAKDAWNNVITTAWVPDISDTKNKGAKKFVDTFTKYYPGQTPNAYAIAGWVAAEVFTQGLREAGNDLSWSNYIKSMESLKNWSGDIVTGITYTNVKRNGVEKMYFMRAVYKDDKNFKYEKITDFMSAN